MNGTQFICQSFKGLFNFFTRVFTEDKKMFGAISHQSQEDKR